MQQWDSSKNRIRFLHR